MTRMPGHSQSNNPAAGTLAPVLGQEAHDSEVEHLLDCFNNTRERFRHSFPKEELEPPS